MQRNFAKIHAGDGPVNWLGVNFWSRAGGPLMWRNYDAAVVESELATLAEHGLTITRSFFYWPDFMPGPDSVDDKLVSRYQDFLDAHRRNGLQTIPTFIVGHMSGENWDPAWRGGRDLYTDVWLIARQAWFVREMTARFAEHPAVAGWLISNEMPIYGGHGSTAAVTSWAELMVQAVRAGGGHQPVSIGDGAWGIEVTGADNGFSVRELGAITDFVGPHVYRMETDLVRQHLKAAFICELAAIAGRPVVLEEFGLSSDFASDENCGHYYRQTLHNSLLAGATGWIAWNNTDFDDLVAQDPYRHHPFELHFGVTRTDGTPKPPLLELQDFAELIRRVDIRSCERRDSQVAVVVSEYLEIDEPLSVAEERATLFAALEQAHVAAREADLPPAFVRERDGLGSGAALYLVPSTKQLTGPSWYRLQELAEQGSTVYVSYCVGESPRQRGPWWTNTEALFGVRHQLVYGLNDPIDAAEVVLTVEAPFGNLTIGDQLRFRAAGGPNARAFLPVEVTSGEVIARDRAGRPALIRKDHGTGTAVLCSYPLEYMAAAQGRVNPEETWRLYAALAVHAGVERPVTVDDPLVMVDAVQRSDGSRFVWFVSHHSDSVQVTPTVASGGLRSLDEEDLTTFTLPPFGVAVARMTSDG